MSSLTATAILRPDFNITDAQNITGGVLFNQAGRGSNITITLNAAGLPPNTTHGWHIHSVAVADGPVNCALTGSHFNPLNATHGAPSNNASTRHVGDLGNFKTDMNGTVALTVTDPLISLYAPYSVLNLAVVLHSNADDLGLGNNSDSLKTGNAGSRWACGNIKLSDITTPTAGPTSTTPSPTSTPNAALGLGAGLLSFLTLLVL